MNDNMRRRLISLSNTGNAIQAINELESLGMENLGEIKYQVRRHEHHLRAKQKDLAAREKTLFGEDGAITKLLMIIKLMP